MKKPSWFPHTPVREWRHDPIYRFALIGPMALSAVGLSIVLLVVI